MTTEERLSGVEAKLQEMTDRQAIFDCIKRNFRGNDCFDADLVVGSSHTNGLHEVGDHTVPGPGYGAHADQAHGALFDANLHNVTMHMCEVDVGVAHAETYSLGMFLDKGGETGCVLAGRYIDRLEKRGGEWRIALPRSTVKIALEGKAALPTGVPLPGSGNLRGNRDRTAPSYERPLSARTGGRW